MTWQKNLSFTVLSLTRRKEEVVYCMWEHGCTILRHVQEVVREIASAGKKRMLTSQGTTSAQWTSAGYVTAKALLVSQGWGIKGLTGSRGPGARRNQRREN